MTIYSYARFSVEDQSGQSVTIASQQDGTQRYAALHWPGQPIVLVADEGVSGGVPLAGRPQGGPMLSGFVRGDHLIVHRTDRLFRSVADGAARILEFEKRGVNLHLLDLGMDTSTPIGRAMAHVAIAFAQLERERCGERRRTAAAYRRANGVPTMDARHAPLGWRIIQLPSRRAFRRDITERKACQRLKGLRSRGWTYDRIVQHANRERIRRRGRRKWTRSGVRRAIIAARDGYPLISEDCRRWGSESR